MLHFGQTARGLGLIPSLARRLPEREFECFLFGTAMNLPENRGLFKICNHGFYRRLPNPSTPHLRFFTINAEDQGFMETEVEKWRTGIAGCA